MIIKEVTAKNFGQFHNKTVQFEPGLNLVYGENESGKSTLHTFIRAMFFGMRKQRGRVSRTDRYTRYEPWDNSAYYAGMMRFVCDNKLFRLSRSFQKMKPGSELVCETDGEVLSIEQGDLEMLLGGMSETIYDNTVSVGQLQSRTDDGLVTELRNYMANYQGGGDGGLDIRTAQELLKKRRKEQETAQKEKEQEQRHQKETLMARMSYLRGEISEASENLEQKEKEHRQIPKTETGRMKTGKSKSPVSIWSCMAAAAALLTIVGCIVSSSTAVRGFVITIGLLFVFLLLSLHGRTGKKRQKKEYSLDQEKVRWSVERYREEIREKQIQLDNMQADYDAYCEAELQAGMEEENIQAIATAEQRIEELARAMQQASGTGLKNRMSDILFAITEGRYGKIQIDDDFHMGVHAKQHYVPMEQLSSGTVDQIYFALRMAANQILSKEERMPVLLDDVFAMYDEKRLMQTLAWLAKQEQQVILFTCHKREMELLERMGIDYTCQRL